MNLKNFNNAIAQFENDMHPVIMHLDDVIKLEQEGDVDQAARMLEDLLWRALKLAADGRAIKAIVNRHHPEKRDRS